MNDEIEELKRQVAQLQKDVAAIKRVRFIAQNLTAQDMSENLKMKRPSSDKAVRLREDK